MLNFTKYQGLGNDFLVIDQRPELGSVDFPSLTTTSIVRLCHRRFGVGADGLLLVLPPENDGDVRMRIFNSDGSEPEMCGNGIRCLASYLFTTDESEFSSELKIETLAGLIRASISDKNQISVSMGRPSFNPSEIPTLLKLGKFNIPEGIINIQGEDIEVYAAGMGNPHLVIKVDNLENVLLGQDGPTLENHQLFPSNTNVHFVEVKSESNVKVLHWERGCGATLACGTGACAIHAVLLKIGVVKETLHLELPGGNLTTSWQSLTSQIYMTGPATKVFSGFIAEDQLI